MSLKADLEYAIHQHSAWKMKFRDFLGGKAGLDVPSIAEANHCQFGKWMEAEGKRLLPPHDFNEIHKLHVEFHHVAAEVIRKIKEKDFAGARNDISGDGAFNQASLTLVTYMLRAALHTPSKPAPVAVPAEAGQPAAQVQTAELSPPSMPPENTQEGA